MPNGETRNRVWYEFNDTGSKEPIEIFIHGNSAPSNWLMDTVNQRNKAGKSTLVFDLPGHGQSDKIEDYYLDTMISALITVIDDSGVANHKAGYNMVGWSYGGNIATHALEQKLLPDLKNLVLIGTPPLNLNDRKFPLSFRYNSFAKKVIKNTYNLIKDLSEEQMILMVQSFLCHNYYLDDELFASKVLLQSVTDVDSKVRSDIVDSFSNGMFHDEISILKEREPRTKLHFLYGIYDALVNPEYIKEVAEYVGADSCVGLPTGHAAMFENPVVVSSALDKCFTKNK